MASATAYEAPTIKDGARKDSVFLTPSADYPGLRRVHDDPPLYEIPGFLTPEECRMLIEAGRGGLKRSIVVDGAAGKSPAPSRTSESCYLSKDTYAWLLTKISAATGKPAATQEPPQVARYLKTQLYLAHFDAFDLTTGPGRECASSGGQRVATVLIYLNSVSEGGGTYFPKLDLRFKPREGTAVVFFPCDLDGRLDPLALHTAEAAVDEKWVCQVWIRQGEFK